MRILSLHLTNYKAYKEPVEVRIRPLTILVGRNNAGKTALLRAVPLIAHSLTGAGKAVVRLETDGLVHGSSFEELIHGQHIHGSLELGATFGGSGANRGFSTWIQNVVQPKEAPARVVSRFRLLRDGAELLDARRLSVLPGEAQYRLAGDVMAPLGFDGLLPRDSAALSWEARGVLDELRHQGPRIAEGIHYLRAQRAVPDRFLELPPEPPPRLAIDGAGAPELLAQHDGLRKAVFAWFASAFEGLALDVTRTGPVFQITVRGGQGRVTPVVLENAGHGLSQVLPVAVQRLAWESFGPGLDLIEQPESDLHPAAHGAVADLFVDSVRKGGRSALVETHSEMFLLRVRRRIAEGRLPPEDVGIYWVDADAQGGAALREVGIDSRGEVKGWPHGVFFEDYEEVLAIRRAARKQEGGG